MSCACHVDSANAWAHWHVSTLDGWARSYRQGDALNAREPAQHSTTQCYFSWMTVQSDLVIQARRSEWRPGRIARRRRRKADLQGRVAKCRTKLGHSPGRKQCGMKPYDGEPELCAWKYGEGMNTARAQPIMWQPDHKSVISCIASCTAEPESL